ncbi:hypothetical protein OH687_19355 [Burkholderia anthina]|nr:hypothetical protein OH687_19355 [Burkholderia anthina]
MRGGRWPEGATRPRVPVTRFDMSAQPPSVAAANRTTMQPAHARY